MKELFDICVTILNWIARQCGISYEEANIWIFVIIHPLMTMILLIIVIYQRGQLRIAKRIEGFYESQTKKLNDALGKHLEE